VELNNINIRCLTYIGGVHTVRYSWRTFVRTVYTWNALPMG